MQIHQLSGTERSPITEATRPAAGAAQRSSGKPRPRHPRCLILQRPGFGYSVHPRHPPHHRTADATAGSRRPANLSQTMRLRFRGIPLRSNSRHFIPAAGLGTEPGIHPLLQPTLHEISKSRQGDSSFHPSEPHGAYRSTLAPLRLGTPRRAEPTHLTALRVATQVHRQLPRATVASTHVATHRQSSNIPVHKEPAESNHTIVDHNPHALP